MVNIDVKDLINENRFPDSVLKILYLLLYTPIGIVFVLVRLLIALLAVLLASALPDVAALRKTVSRLLCVSLGVIVKEEETEKRDKSTKVIVSNHVSSLDHLALHCVTDSVMPTKYKMQSVLENALGLYYLNTSLTEEIVSNNRLPIAVQPEEAITNGKGILKFKTQVFNLNIKVQPVSLRVWRPPIADLAVRALGSEWWADIMTYLFVPCTLYTVKFLPTIDKGEYLENDFAEKVRVSIANSLKIPVTPYTSRDLIEYEKRFALEQRLSLGHNSLGASGGAPARLASMSLPSHDPILDRMAHQVKEVLPRVPFNIILNDLVKTRSIDITISNILEGHVRYIPEELIPPSASPSPVAANGNQSSNNSPNHQPSTSTGTAPSPLSTAASNFAKSANERMQSFQERKRQLIENARKRYIDKHGLNIAMNNC